MPDRTKLIKIKGECHEDHLLTWAFRKLNSGKISDFQRDQSDRRSGVSKKGDTLTYIRKEWVDDGRTPHREHVLIEKIIGTFRSFRSTKGAEYNQYIKSLFATWRLQKKCIFDELDVLLRRELCGVR